VISRAAGKQTDIVHHESASCILWGYRMLIHDCLDDYVHISIFPYPFNAPIICRATSLPWEHNSKDLPEHGPVVSEAGGCILAGQNIQCEHVLMHMNPPALVNMIGQSCACCNRAKSKVKQLVRVRAQRRKARADKKSTYRRG